MNTKLATAQIRLDQWAAVIQDQKSSGLKVNEYCEKHNLSRDSYYYWLRKVKSVALQQAGFVELTQTTGSRDTDNTEASSFTAQMMIRMGDFELSISEGTSMELLEKVLGVIRHAE